MGGGGDSESLEEGMLLAFEMQEGPTSQGMRGFLEAVKGRKPSLPWRPFRSQPR